VASDFDPAFRTLEAELRKLEAEYNMFFAGQLPRPPWETRTSVEQTVKRLDRIITSEGSSVDKFRLQTLQARFMTFIDLWDRGLKAREEGRPGPFDARRTRQQAPVPEQPQAKKDRLVYVTTFADPMDELDKLHELYERLADVRRDLGESQVPFHRFASLIRDQVTTIKGRGAPEVAFRVAVQDGKIAFSARGLVGFPGEEGNEK
jgi:hypothetical protein